MKKILSFIGAALIGVFAMTSCSPDDFGTVDPNGIPSLEGVEPVVQVDQTINQVTFSLPENCKGVMPIWIFDGKTYSTVNGLKKIFTSAGDYTAEFKLMNKNGISDGSKSFTFHIDNTIFNFDKYYTLMCGGAEGSEATKEWRIDNKAKGHMGCGPAGTTGTEWWSAGEDDKAAFGVYDNRVTFGANNTYTFDPGEAGTMYVNYGCTTFNTTGATEDFTVPVEAKTVEYKFEVEGDDLYLTLPAETPFPYVPYDANWSSPRFKVESVTPSTINLVADNGDIAWHFILTSGAAEVKFTGFNYKHEANIWRPVDEKADYTTSFWYAPGWNQIADPGFKQDGDAYTFTLPQATSDQWQAQCFIIPNNLQLESSKTYDFSCVISSTTDIDGVTVKIPNVADNGPALFTERFPVKAYEDYVFYITDCAGFDDVAKLVLDFGGNKDNCEVTVKNIVLKDHAVDDGTVIPSVEPEPEGPQIIWADPNSPENLLNSGKLTLASCWWANDGWAQIGDPDVQITGNDVKITATEANGGSQWQGQVHLNTGVVIEEGKSYDFKIVLAPTADINATVKPHPEGDDNHFFTADQYMISAYEDNVVTVEGFVADFSTDNLVLTLDFPGCAAGTEISVKNIIIQEHNATAGPVVWAGVDTPDNLMSAANFVLNSCWWANDGWAQIADPDVQISGRTAKITVTEANGGSQWQGQCHFGTGVAIEEGATYDFKITINTTANVNATVKPHPDGDDNHFITADQYQLAAYEDNVVKVEGYKADFSTSDLVLTLDFPGMPVGAVIEVKDIILQLHK